MTTSPSDPQEFNQKPEGAADPAPPINPPHAQPAGGPGPQYSPPVGQGQPYSPPVSGPATPLNPADDKQWATFAHFGGVLGILPSLIIYLVFKDRGQFTRQESQEALNFQITAVAAWFGVLILSFIPLIGLLFSLLFFAVWIGVIVFSIIGGMAANKAQPYRYPISYRVIK